MTPRQAELEARLAAPPTAPALIFSPSDVVALARMLHLPMSDIDQRPWVPTLEESR